MGEYINGYVVPQIIRKNAGSPFSFYTFSERSETIMIDNLGSALVYFNFTGSPFVPTGSLVGVVPSQSARIFDVQAGSIAIQGSGLTSSSVQVIRLT